MCYNKRQKGGLLRRNIRQYRPQRALLQQESPDYGKEAVSMEKREFFAQLDKLGVNTQQALDRFMGNEELFLSFVGKLPEKLGLDSLVDLLEKEDEEQFYMDVHNLKGLAGNLSIVPIYDCAQAILVEFRSSHFRNKKKLAMLVEEVREESRTLARLIRRYQEEGGENG